MAGINDLKREEVFVFPIHELVYSKTKFCCKRCFRVVTESIQAKTGVPANFQLREHFSRNKILADLHALLLPRNKINLINQFVFSTLIGYGYWANV